MSDKRRIYAIQGGYDACTEYRIAAPFDALNATGRWDATFGPARADVAAFDVIVGPRLGDAPCPEWEMACRDPDVFAVYEMDDDLLHIDPENTIPFQRYQPWLPLITRYVQMADLVTVCTPYAAERMSELNQNVTILPVCIRDEYLRPPRDRGERPITLGWAGAPFHHQDWEELLPRLHVIAGEHPHVWFHSMGADYTSGAFAGRLRATGLQPHSSYLAELDFDIGLAPLRRSPHNRGKSWTKLLEYGSQGIPFIGTSWGQYPDWLDQGPLGGLLIDSDDDWIDYASYLIDENERRREYAWNNYRTARAMTVSRNIEAWEKALMP